MRKWEPVPRHPNVYSYETKKGMRFGIRRGYTTSLGKRDEYTKSGFKSWRDAEQVLKTFEADLVTGKGDSITRSKITLERYFKRMSDRKLKYGTWRDSTYEVHTRYFNQHIKPAFGTRRMNEITRGEYQAFLDSLAEKKGLAASTIRTIHRIMMETLNAAESEDVIEKNRLGRMEIHGAEPKSVEIDPKDYDIWISEAEKQLDRYSFAMIQVATLGLRRGEILGLRTDSIRFQTNEATGEELAEINIDLQRGEDYPTGGPLKTSSSYRKIWVGGELVDALHFAILSSDNLRKKNGIPESTTKWLWLNRYGRPASSFYLFEHMKIVNKATGIKLRPHMLRHYFATRSISANTPEIDVMHFLGHKTIQMTADYTRPTKDASLKVFSNFDKAANGSDSNS